MGAMKDFDRRIRQGGDDAIAAVSELLQVWIPVSERLPDEGEDVLAYSAAIGAQVARLDGKSWYWGTSGILSFDATHWMPLPEPPEVK